MSCSRRRTPAARLDVKRTWTVRWEALWAELSRRESCLGVEKGKLVAWDTRCACASSRATAACCGSAELGGGPNRIHGLSWAFLCLSCRRARVASARSKSPGGGRPARALARPTVLWPLGLAQGENRESWRPLRTSVAPRAPHQLPGVATRVAYHFFGVVLDGSEDRAAERKAEALLDAASRDPAEKWRFVDRCFGDDVPTPPTDCAAAWKVCEGASPRRS